MIEHSSSTDRTVDSLRLAVALVWWVVTAAPFAVESESRTIGSLVFGILITGCVVVTARRLPLAALGVAATACLLDWRYVLALAVAAHVAGLCLPTARQALLVFSAAGGLGGVIALVLGADPYDWPVRIGALAVFGLFPWLVGGYRRQRATLLRSGWQRASRLEEQQRIVADRARYRERARIAGDMHDFLGHHLSLAALRAGALELAPDLAPRHVAAVGELRISIASATEQLREVIGVLRGEGEAASTAPTGEGIRALVEHSVAAGLTVDLVGDVEPSSLDAMCGRAAYRLVQEGLTNAATHAPGSAVVVALTGNDGGVQVRVTNGPATGTPVAGTCRGQTGLTGLQERARVVGGTFSAGPVPDGFAVTMQLPWAGAIEPAPAPLGTGWGVEREYRHASHRVRRSLVIAVFGPLAAGLVLVAALMGIYAYDSFTSVLSARQFDAMSTGQARVELTGALPERQVPERGAAPLPPADSACEYYRSTAGFLPSTFDVYRLCFRDDRLVSKDVLDR